MKKIQMKMEIFKVYSLALKVYLEYVYGIFSYIYITLFCRFSAYLGILLLYRCMGKTEKTRHP